MARKLCVEAGYVCTCAPPTSGVCYLDQEIINRFGYNRAAKKEERDRIGKMLEEGKIDEVRTRCLDTSMRY